MQIKSNTPLSDNEMKKVSDILRQSKCPYESLRSTFPGVNINMTDNVIWFGNPPWDLSQEVIYEK